MNNVNEPINTKIKTNKLLKDILGLDIFQETKHNFDISELEINNNYTQINATINTEPHITMPFFILVPDLIDSIEKVKSYNFKKLPVVIVPHGHGSDGRYGVTGIHRNIRLIENQELYNHDIGVQFVKQGYIVFCPDARGSGDRRNVKEQGADLKSLLSSSCMDLNNYFITQGSSLLGAWIWDLKCLIKFIIESEFGDSTRIGVCGFSGGGLQALFLGAIDKRVKCVGVSGYLYKLEDTLFSSNLCSCNFIPSFNKYFDLAFVAKQIAPRALIIEKALNDPLNGIYGIKGPRELSSTIQDYYSSISATNKYYFSEVKGKHRFNGKEIFDFFNNKL